MAGIFPVVFVAGTFHFIKIPPAAYKKIAKITKAIKYIIVSVLLPSAPSPPSLVFNS
jgi:hypothetical protein